MPPNLANRLVDNAIVCVCVLSHRSIVRVSNGRAFEIGDFWFGCHFVSDQPRVAPQPVALYALLFVSVPLPWKARTGHCARWLSICCGTVSKYSLFAIYWIQWLCTVWEICHKLFVHISVLFSYIQRGSTVEVCLYFSLVTPWIVPLPLYCFFSLNY